MKVDLIALIEKEKLGLVRAGVEKDSLLTHICRIKLRMAS
jgi:hypothetical protein